MKYFALLSLFFTLSAGLLQAQPVITRDDLMFPGDQVRDILATMAPAPGQGGADVHWDFSAVQEGGSGARLNVVAAQTTPYFNLYPQSNIAFVDGALTPQYYQYNLLNANIWEDLGHVAPGFYILRYHTPRTTMEFPCTYNSQWQDDYTYTIEYQLDPPIITAGEGVLNASADGYGSLSLPQGTFDQVLRVRTTSVAMDTTELGVGLYERNDIYDTTYVWLSPGYHAALCTYVKSVIMRRTMTSSDTLDEQFEFVAFSFDNTAEPTSSLWDHVTSGIHALQVSPNPVEHEMRLEFIAGRPQVMYLSVYNLLGNVVYAEIVSAHSGQNVHRLSLHSLVPGTYVLTLQSEDGMDMQKIICTGGQR